MSKETKFQVKQSEIFRPKSDSSKACLVHIYPPEAGGKVYPLDDNQVYIVGRDPDCTIRITDKSVSRKHCRLQPEGESFVVVDLNSTNGTFVNNERIERKTLENSDRLHIGTSILRFLIGGTIEASYHEEIYRLTIIDALTNTYNLRFFHERLEHELSRSARYIRPLSLMMLDIDHFKSLNDAFGHLAGDFVLRELANCVGSVLRKEDYLCRYGGEEFAVILPETDSESAMSLAERVRAAVAEHPFQFENQSFQVTLSIGVATVIGDPEMTVTGFTKLADDRLYQAKLAGRNRVAGPEPKSD